jgi:hypothetical protein
VDAVEGVQEGLNGDRMELDAEVALDLAKEQSTGRVRD